MRISEFVMRNKTQRRRGVGELNQSERASTEMREEDHSAFRILHFELDPSELPLPVSEADQPDALLLQRWLDLNA